MKDLFKFLFSKTQCQKSGICSTNPIMNAVSAVILNEIRQISFYVVKLHEINIINKELVQNTIEALSVNISDVNFNKSAILNFYKNLYDTKENIKNFYGKKAQELKMTYEFINPIFEENIKDTTGLIKAGENIIREFYNKINEEKFRLIKTVLLISKTASSKLIELQNYKEVDFSYYYEILRLLSLTNHRTTREEKFIRRIKEFSEILYKIQEELDFELSKKFGKKEEGRSNSNIYEGKSILVLGEDIEELYNLLEKTKNENINIYINSSLISSIFYPNLIKFPHFKGIYGTSELEVDFSNFKGAIYITQNSSQSLDSVFRGSIFTTKKIPYEKAKQIDKNNLSPLIEEAKALEGFKEFIKGAEINFEYNLDKIIKTVEENKDKKILLYFGLIEEKITEKFKDYIIINFKYPYETEGLHYILNNFMFKDLNIYFSKCTKNVVTTVLSIINKTNIKLYIPDCTSSYINPHITTSLNKDFGINII